MTLAPEERDALGTQPAPTQPAPVGWDYPPPGDTTEAPAVPPGFAPPGEAARKRHWKTPAAIALVVAV
ncbi:MAG TPA: hypothetical protein VEJ21_02060, partial [Acidimicrobiales bacterium]|nr:hypothetical protein [Acidimicrobiales bacterium]